MRGDAGFPVRMRFAKRGKVRFISHRDVARAFERAFRIEALPIAFTQGFAPRPKVSFGLALSVGHESDAEYLDVELVEPVDLEALPERLDAALPEGITVRGVARLRERAPALQESVSAVTWEVTVTDELGDIPDREAVGARLHAALGAPALPVTRVRKGRSVIEDVRPALREGSVLAVGDDGVVLGLEVSTRPLGVRPAEIVAALGGGLREARARRTHQWIERDGARWEPLDADAPRAAGARA